VAIHPHRGGWKVVVYVGIDPVTGRQRRITRQVAGGKRQAERVEAKLRAEVAEGRHRGTGARTLGELLEVWYEWRTTNGEPLSPTVRNDYQSVITTKLKPALGKLRLPQVDARTLDRYYGQLASSGRTVRIRDGVDPVTGKPRWRTERAPLSTSRVHQVHAVLSGALGLAARYGWIPLNPALLAKPPTGGGKRRAAASPEQVREVLQAAEQRDPELYLFLRIAATTGLRPGEAVALRWCDLDLDAPAVMVSGNIVHARGLPSGYVRKPPKSEHGVRVLGIDPGTADLLRTHQARCEARAAAWNGWLAGNGYLFATDESGRHPVRRDSIGSDSASSPPSSATGTRCTGCGTSWRPSSARSPAPGRCGTGWATAASR
jgi:integrase